MASSKNLVRFSGIAGTVILLMGFATGLMANFEGLALAYFLAHLVIGAILLLVWFISHGKSSIGNLKSSLSGRSASVGVETIISTVLFVAILVLVNWYVSRHDKKYDLTESGVYSLAEQSTDLISKLDKPLKLVGVKAGETALVLEELLKRYKEVNTSKVSVELIDPISKPHLLDKYGLKTGNLIYIKYGEGDNGPVSRLNDATEEAVTNAILKLKRGSAKKIYYVVGHDEPLLSEDTGKGTAALKGAIEDENYKVEDLILSDKETIPEDAAAVLLVSPKKSLLPQEKEMLVKYANSGGRLLMATDPRTTDDIRDIASSYGITVGNDVIVDQVQRLFAGPAMGVQPLITSYGKSPITDGFGKETITVFNMTSSLSKADGFTDKDAKIEDLLKTGGKAWGETNLELLLDSSEPAVAFDTEDKKGPVVLGMSYEKKVSSEGSDKNDFNKVARVVVFGDSDWLQNSSLSVYANRDLALNTVNWLTGEEGGVTIRPKAMRASEAPLDAASFLAILASSFLLPELILLLGLFFWWRRKQS